MKLRQFCLAVVMCAGALTAHAGDALLKPFVLAWQGPAVLAEKSAEVKAALNTAGFELAGDYRPYAGTEILVVTSPALKHNAAASDAGGYGAVQRVSLSEAGGKVQVSYTNPVYMAAVYRMAGDLSDVSAALEKALGRVEEFGSARGMTAKQARKYHYMIGMEYFDEPSLLAEYGSHEAAVKAVDAGLSRNANGIGKVYRVDVPGKQESVFGVSMKGSDAAKYRDEQFIMSEIDFHDVKSAAHLPYEILVSGNKAYALYARFRIAINFPDLSMMGKNSFMNIMKTPDAIRDALAAAIKP